MFITFIHKISDLFGVSPEKNDAKTPKVQSGTWAPFVASGRRGVVLTSRKQGAIGPGTRFPGDATARISCTGLIVDSDPDV
jgi:hypothetical protein